MGFDKSWLGVTGRYGCPRIQGNRENADDVDGVIAGISGWKEAYAVVSYPLAINMPAVSIGVG